jgi:hypothetical protein
LLMLAVTSNSAWSGARMCKSLLLGYVGCYAA